MMLTFDKTFFLEEWVRVILQGYLLTINVLRFIDFLFLIFHLFYLMMNL